MFTSPYPLELSVAERAELEAMTRSRTLAAGLVQRARVILAIADEEPYPVLSPRLSLSTTTLTRWRKRFEQRRLAGLLDEGTIVDGKTTAPGEMRGASIRGGTDVKLGPGDVLHIPAKVPHQMQLAAGAQVTYFVTKVVE